MIISPVYLSILYYSLVGIGGYLIYPNLEQSASSVGAILSLSSREYDETFLAYMYIITIFMFGVVSFLLIPRPFIGLSREDRGLLCSNKNIYRSLYIFESAHLNSRNYILIFFIGFLPVIFQILGTGLDNIWQRDEYIVSTNRFFKILGNLLALFAVAAYGFLFMRSRGLKKILPIAMLILYLLVFAALSSRQFALCLIFFSIGAYVNDLSSKKAKWAFYISIVISPFLMIIPLTLRNQSIQGLEPFLNYVFSLSSEDYIYVHDLSMVLKNFIATFPLTGFAWNATSFDISYLLVSLNPLPGVMTNWYIIMHDLFITPVTMYNAIGQLLNHGILITGGYFFFIGFYFCHIELLIRKLIIKRHYLIAAAFFSLPVLFVLQTSQYSLRSATRIIYLLIAIEVTLKFYTFFFKRKAL